MRAVDIIAKKRDGEALSDEEIRWFIERYVKDKVPDYQASALLMAIFLRGMTARETTALTMAIVESGEQLDLSEFGRVVDKHSSGGVGDKTTLVVGPIVAATGLPVAKMSGRGLGFTGGTLDKLESIPGFRIDLSHDEFLAQVREIGLVVTGTTRSIAPGDKKLYALRDVTATVDSLPLIASSIMSKKLAAGADAIVLDVKVGRGAFMQTVDDARALAKTMVDIGRRTGRDVTALLSDMDQPLGRMAGNALEVREAIETLRGHGPEDFEEHCLVVAAHMLFLGRKADSLESARQLSEEVLRDGRAWAAFRRMVEAQGGDVGYIDEPERLPKAPIRERVEAPREGFIAGLDAREVGLTVVQLGGGREKKEDAIDPSVGVVVLAKIGDFIQRGSPLFEVHAATMEEASTAGERLLAAIRWSDSPVTAPPPFHDVISSHASMEAAETPAGRESRPGSERRES